MNLFQAGLPIAATLLVAVISWSASSGVAEAQNRNRTGSPGSDAPCSACHGGGAYGAAMAIEVLDAATELPVAQYTPGADYLTRYTMTNSTGSPAGFGFQATALVDVDNTDAGTFSDPGSFVQLEFAGGHHIVEHSFRKMDGIFEATWTAPTTGSGDVTFYGSGIAANGSGTAGDQYAGTTFTIAEGEPISTAGCTYAQACNYDAAATMDNGSCDFDSCTLAADINGDGAVAVADLLILLSQFGESME